DVTLPHSTSNRAGESEYWLATATKATMCGSTNKWECQSAICSMAQRRCRVAMMASLNASPKARPIEFLCRACSLQSLSSDCLKPRENRQALDNRKWPHNKVLRSLLLSRWPWPDV